MQRCNYWPWVCMVIAAACGARSELDDGRLSAGVGGAGASGTSETGGSMMYCRPTPGPIQCHPVVCPSGVGPAMVALPLDYCIDSTEVTQAQYRAWLSTNPSTSAQVSLCNWNRSFVPNCNWPPITTADYPVVCVDWCDANAYCANAGKRLCGKMGGGAEEYNEDASSQWYEACTSNSTYAYPYGNEYNPVACNGLDASKGATVEVGSMTQCHSTISDYSGAYDLSGNVWEWVDSCIGNTGSSDNCRIRGGGFVQAASDVTCAAVNNGPRNYFHFLIGFRCCS